MITFLKSNSLTLENIPSDFTSSNVGNIFVSNTVMANNSKPNYKNGTALYLGHCANCDFHDFVF